MGPEKGGPKSETDTEESFDTHLLSKFKLYESERTFYLFGTDNNKKLWRVLKIDRCRTSELEIFEDPALYTERDCNELLMRLDASNRSTGGLKLVTKAFGIVGFIKFLEPYYMILVTRRRLLGHVVGHPIYGISESKIICVTHPSFQTDIASSNAENRYKKLFSSMDLTKDFFFSHSYSIMQSVQKNVLNMEAEKTPYDSMFAWNSYLTFAFREQVENLHWLVPLVYGFFKQRKLLEHNNVVYKITLIARRSRHFAGTRYLKRGVNEKGRVANDVETEQIVHEESSGGSRQISSVVQHRGSIPLFWSQDTSVLSPKPDIKLKRDDSNYKATRQHFQNLALRYGNPIIVLNLVKTTEKKPRETVLCHEFSRAVGHLNNILPKESHIKFIQWDLHKFANCAASNVMEVLGTITTDALNHVGFFYSSDLHLQSPHDNICPSETLKALEVQNKGMKLQHGVLRSNCIDCLDRTNVAQFSFGLAALRQQLHALGLHDHEQLAMNNFHPILMEMYENMGDALALQYGGSTAHNTVLSNWQGKWKAATQSLDFLRAIRRHYSNAYTDGLKQDAINIFLGHYCPTLGNPPLWELDSKHHFQVGRSELSLFINRKSSIKRSLSEGLLEGNGGILSPIFDMRQNFPAIDEFSTENDRCVTVTRNAETSPSTKPPILNILIPTDIGVENYPDDSREPESSTEHELSSEGIFFVPGRFQEAGDNESLKSNNEDFSKHSADTNTGSDPDPDPVRDYSERFVQWMDGSCAFAF